MGDTVWVVCQHGNELTPLEIIKRYFKDKVSYIIANSEAVHKNKRFIESDLNRSFNGKSNTFEEKIAQKLLKELKKYKYVLDFHTSTSDTPIFIIMTKITPKHLNLSRKLGITIGQLNMAWALHQPFIKFIIVGTTNPEYLEINLNANNIKLDNEIVKQIDAAYFKLEEMIKSQFGKAVPDFRGLNEKFY